MELCTKYGYEQKFYRLLRGHACVCDTACHLRRVHCRQQEICTCRRSRKTVYLTFDDGPSARTPEVLKILEEYGVKATFFVVGKDTEQSKQWMRDIVAAGHTIGVHSFTHDYREIYSSVEDYLDDFAKEYALIEEVTGVPPQIFRFPGGSINAYNGHIYQEIVAR